MSTLLTTRSDKSAAIFILGKVMEGLAYHGMSRNDVMKTQAHIQAMDMDPRDLDVLCQLASDPSTGRTVLAVTYTFKGVPNAN